MKTYSYILCTIAIAAVSVHASGVMHGGNNHSVNAYSPTDTILSSGKSFKESIKDMQKDDSLSYDDFKAKAYDKYDNEKADMIKRYEQYRDSVMKDFIAALKRPWENKDSRPAEPRPIDESVGPDVINKDVAPNIVDNDKVKEENPAVTPAQQVKKSHIEGEIKLKEVFTLPEFNPALRPVPFVPVVVPKDINVPCSFTFQVFGTPMDVNIDDENIFKLSGTDNNAVAEAVEKISANKKYSLLLKQCLQLRDDYKLCDWAYFKTLQSLGNQFLGDDTNEAVLFTGYMFCMSGYKLRYAFDSDKKLRLLIACEQDIVDQPYVTIPEGSGFCTYYIMEGSLNGKSMQLCNYQMPKEKAMSLHITDEPLFYENASGIDMALHSYPSVQFGYNVNKNLIDFYSTYPTPLTRGDSYSKWTYYANAPMSSLARETVYPAVRSAIEGRSAFESVNVIMDMIESYKYGYDDEIWGYDRAFFPDETLFYPMSDCEDHAILLTRMVRDLLNLPTALLYYPGHLAAAVCFDSDDARGDYIMYEGKKYTVCDPTIYYAGAGRTMRGMNNKEATLIIIR